MFQDFGITKIYKLKFRENIKKSLINYYWEVIRKYPREVFTSHHIESLFYYYHSEKDYSKAQILIDIYKKIHLDKKWRDMRHVTHKNVLKSRLKIMERYLKNEKL